MRMPVRAGLVAAAAAMLAACGSFAAPTASGPSAHPSASTSASARPGPPAGNRAEAAALARRVLSRIWLPSGARRLPSAPLPPALREPPLWAQAAAATDMHRLFQLAQPEAAAAAILTAHVPSGMSLGITGSATGPSGVTTMQVAYDARSVPAGIYQARLVLTIAPASTGGSLVRADAQVIWYPPRTAAEYIDPSRYHVLRITVTILNPRTHTIGKIVTSPAVIAQLADALNQSPVQPVGEPSCPVIFATYQLEFAVSLHSAPDAVITATRWPCGGADISVGGRRQPPLEDGGVVVATADRLLGINPEPGQRTGPATTVTGSVRLGQR
jgi:hypothetical protein